MSKPLKLDKVCKRFGNLVAVDEVSLDIEPGEFICFLGPSGCGKTTLLRLITGFERLTSGRILHDGNVINHLPPQKRDFGIVFQSYALFPNMTVTQNIAFGLKMRNMPQNLMNKRVDEMLELIGLKGWQDHYPSQLSGGQQQRVALGRAIAIEPNVLLLDEPLSALDAKIRVRLRTVIKRLQQDLGVTLIYVTHDQEEALALADRVVIMRDGQFRQIGSPWEIYKKPGTSFIAEFVGTSNFLAGTKNGGKVQYGSHAFTVSEIESVGAEGDKVYLAIRPENIELVGASIAREECLPGNIVETTAEVVNFLGAVVRVTFMLEGEEMLFDIPEKDFEKVDLSRGKKISLYFPPDGFHAYTEIFSKLI